MESTEKRSMIGQNVLALSYYYHLFYVLSFSVVLVPGFFTIISVPLRTPRDHHSSFTCVYARRSQQQYCLTCGSIFVKRGVSKKSLNYFFDVVWFLLVVGPAIQYSVPLLVRVLLARQGDRQGSTVRRSKKYYSWVAVVTTTYTT